MNTLLAGLGLGTLAAVFGREDLFFKRDSDIPLTLNPIKEIVMSNDGRQWSGKLVAYDGEQRDRSGGRYPTYTIVKFESASFDGAVEAIKWWVDVWQKEGGHKPPQPSRLSTRWTGQ
jgi:hypothetical protein